VRASVLRCMPWSDLGWCILRGPSSDESTQRRDLQRPRACEHEGYRYAAASVRAATDAQERSGSVVFTFVFVSLHLRLTFFAV
jgi:hypothetical protein